MREAEDIEGTWCVNLLVSHLAIKKLCFSGDSLIPKTEITDDFRAHEFIRYECHPCGNQLIHSITVWVFWLRTFLISVAWIWIFPCSSLKLSPPSLCYLEPHKERSEKKIPLSVKMSPWRCCCCCCCCRPGILQDGGQFAAESCLLYRSPPAGWICMA